MLSTVLVVHFVCMALSFWGGGGGGGLQPPEPPLDPPLIQQFALNLPSTLLAVVVTV